MELEKYEVSSNKVKKDIRLAVVSDLHLRDEDTTKHLSDLIHTIEKIMPQDIKHGIKKQKKDY